MKKIVIASIAIVSMAFNANAQQTQIGVKGGLNIATINYSSTTPSNFKSLVGAHAGLLAHIHLTDMFAIQPEVVYSMQGAKDHTVSSSEVRLGYLNVPVLVQYMFSNGLRLETGPQAGILLSAKEKNNSVTSDLKDQLNGFDFSWAAGLGYLSKMGLGADARFNFGLSDLTKSDLSKVRNNVVQIGLFYQFK